MKKELQTGILFFAIFSLLPLSFFTGGTTSPVRFLFFPLITFFSLYFPSRLLHGAGLAFTILFPLLYVSGSSEPRTVPIFSVLAEVSAFFFCTLVAGFISRRIHQERFRYENAIATFHSLSDALNHKNMNLQTALDALSEAHKKLQDFDKTKTEFLSNVSHEIRTPLSSIRSYSEILLNYDDIEPETQREFLQTINTESERMTRFATEVLDLIRIESGKQEIAFSPICSSDLLTESGRIVRPMAMEKGLELILEETTGLPDVRGDKNQLIQVLVNLLNNAVKFTRIGTIRLGASPRDGFVEFFVSDTGEGIFPEEREEIFQPFTRIAEHGKNRPKGSGLGLSISRGIVEFHGGRIWVDSELGKGSTFYFTIPIVSKRTEVFEQFDMDREGDANVTYRPILVLSSDTVSRRCLRKKLEDVGYHTLGADTPSRAMEIVSTMRPGLIVTEISEDEESFEDLVRWARDAGTRVLLTTLHIHGGDEPTLAVHGYVSKPFDKYEIQSLLEKYHVQGGSILLISPDRDESRTLQVILGAAGFDAILFHEGPPAVRAFETSTPGAVFVGSLRKEQLEEIFTAVKSSSRTAGVPVFQVLGTTLNRFVVPVTLSPVFRKAESKSLYRLVGEIEKEYTKRIE
ncbi:MAG TPA: hybrid sensor histidine kinase/response regulator [Geobacteraceae bacterium]|nr:hybrid sensor histidine kinase/response regulator [Geobacteraceae bacterium]